MLMGENILSKQMYVLIAGRHPRSADLKRLADDWDYVVRSCWHQKRDLSVIETRDFFQAWARANRFYHECIGDPVKETNHVL